MEDRRIAELLAPFVAPEQLTASLLAQLSAYLDLLLRWNARVNLTAVRNPEEIVTRHFGESLFAGTVLTRDQTAAGLTLADVGSGAGFPGIPIKLLAPEMNVVLMESQGKKATFLREVLRTLGLREASVFEGRAERYDKQLDVVTLRAVERFDQALPVAAQLVKPGGRICLLIGHGQVERAKSLLLEAWQWDPEAPIQNSQQRTVLLGTKPAM